MLHKEVSKTLARHPENCASAHAVAEATVGSLHQAAARLASVIGEKGVYVIFRRALHLTSKTYPWLAVSSEDRGTAALLANVQVRLAGQESAAAAEASSALLESFAQLLFSLIGESLTQRLLTPSGSPLSANSEQENTQ